MIDWNSLVTGPVMGVFGEPATFRPAVGAAFPILGTFHEAYASVDLVGGTGVTSVSPAIGVQLSEFPAAPLRKDRVAITPTDLHGGGLYEVKEVQPNGIGGALLMLNRVGN